jgi:hypothetical protein
LAIGLGAASLVALKQLPLGSAQSMQVSEPVQSLLLPSLKQTVNLFIDPNNAFHFQNDKQPPLLAETEDKKQIVVAHTIDKGTVILVGSQVECNAEDLTFIEPKYQSSLKLSNKDRESFFRSLLEIFGRKCVLEILTI